MIRKKEIFADIRCLGSTVVGPRGQVVIPANARKELGLDAGATLLVFTGFRRQGLVLFKVDAVEQMIAIMGEQLNNIGKRVKDYKSVGGAGKKEGDAE